MASAALSQKLLIFYIHTFFCLYSNTVSPSLLLRFNSAPNSMEVRFIEWEKNGSCTDFGRDLQGRNDDFIFSMQMRKEVEFFQSFEMIIIVCLSKKHTYLKKNCDIE